MLAPVRLLVFPRTVSNGSTTATAQRRRARTRPPQVASRALHHYTQTASAPTAQELPHSPAPQSLNLTFPKTGPIDLYQKKKPRAAFETLTEFEQVGSPLQLRLHTRIAFAALGA